MYHTLYVDSEEYVLIIIIKKFHQASILLNNNLPIKGKIRKMDANV